jgi:hypothetical protein
MRWPFPGAATCFLQRIHFHVGGAEDVPGALQLDPNAVAFVVEHGVPGLVVQRDQAPCTSARKRSISARSRVKPTLSASSMTNGSSRCEGTEQRIGPW